MSQPPVPVPAPVATPAAPAPVATPAVAAIPPPLFATPTWFDFLLVLIGLALSLWLAHLAELRAIRSNLTPAWASDEIALALPAALLLPLGVLLFWPVFYTTARLRGRSEHLTFIEYLWGTAWLLDLLLVGLVLWKQWGLFPGLLDLALVKSWLGWSLGWVMLTFALLATFAGVFSLVQRQPRAWTHHLGIALFLWPLLVHLLAWWTKIDWRLGEM